MSNVVVALPFARSGAGHQIVCVVVEIVSDRVVALDRSLIESDDTSHTSRVAAVVAHFAVPLLLVAAFPTTRPLETATLHRIAAETDTCGTISGSSPHNDNDGHGPTATETTHIEQTVERLQSPIAVAK